MYFILFFPLCVVSLRRERGVNFNCRPFNGPDAVCGNLCWDNQKPAAGGGATKSHIHHRWNSEKVAGWHGGEQAEAAGPARRMCDWSTGHSHRPEVSGHCDRLRSGGPEEHKAEAGDSIEKCWKCWKEHQDYGSSKTREHKSKR